MIYSTLHKVGDVVMVAVPSSVLEELHLAAGGTVGIAVKEESLVLTRPRRSKYTVDELLAQCDYSLPMSREDREWLDAPAVGRELI